MPIDWGAYIDYGTSGGKSYFGQAINGADSPAPTFETFSGKAMSIVHFAARVLSNGVNQSFPSSSLNNVWNTGRIPMLNLGTWDLSNHANDVKWSMDNIVAGATTLLPDGVTTLDAYWRTWCQAAAAWRHPFFLRIWQEPNINGGGNPNTNQFPWGLGTYVNWKGTGTGWTNTPANWTAAWRHLHDIAVAAGADNITWVWNPNIKVPNNNHTSPGTGYYSYSEYYPGDAYVDWWGLDGYNQTRIQSAYDSFKDIYLGNVGGLANSYAEITAVAPTKPGMICETGTDDRDPNSNNIDHTAKATWFTAVTQTDLRASFPQVKAFVYAELDYSTRGWSDAIAAASGSTTTVVNLPAGYTPAAGALAGGTITFKSGTNNGVSKTISTNTTTTVTVSTAFASAPAAGDTFSITDPADHWVTVASGSGGATADPGSPNFTSAWKSGIGSPYFAHGAATLGGVSAIADRVLPPDMQTIQPYEARAQQSAFRQAILNAYPSQRLAWWPLNEASGTVAADLFNGHNLTYSGGVTLAQPKISRAVLDLAALFDGSTGIAALANLAAFTTTATNPLSFVIPFRIAATPGATAAIISKVAAGATEWEIGLTTTGYQALLFNTTSTAYAGVVKTQAISTGEGAFHLLIVRFDPSQATPVRTWFDGGAGDNSAAPSGTLQGNTAAAVQIGKRASNDHPYAGAAGHVAVWQASFTDQDAAELYAAFTKARRSPRFG